MVTLALVCLGALAPGLTVSGAKLMYAGKPVTLRGVCVGDIALARDASHLADYGVIAKDWGANCVRIGVAPTTWRKEDKSKTMAALAKDVEEALKQRMFVLIDWHTIGWPDGYFQVPTWEGAKKDLYDSSFDLALDFWRACAKRFGKDGRVGFHLWCEPVYQARDWETPMGSTWTKLRPWFDKLAAAIRREGATNLLVATGNRWAYDLAGIRSNLLKDKNACYMWHVYGGHDDNDPARWARALDDLHTVAPVIVSEWGFQRDTTAHFKGTPDDFGKPFLEFMDKRGLHWTAWCWHPTWGPTMLESDRRTPTEFGRFVKAALAVHAKTAVRP